MKNTKIILTSMIFLCLSFSAFAQQLYPQKFDHGNNNTYTPYTSFVAPVAQPTPLNAPVKGEIANLEENVATKTIKGANSGIHFPKGTPGTKTVRYDLYVRDTIVNYTGKKQHAISVNGSIPAPTLAFTIGDTALIYVHNLADEPTSIHWHGVQLPNRMDGVPYLTQQPIAPHTTYIYKFPVVQTGTYWYHSHVAVQEQIGLYGALIFNKRTEPDIPTIPVVLMDWSGMKAEQINRRLHTGGDDWFAIKKGSVQSYWEAAKAGELGVKFVNEWKRMQAMDVSDVYYNLFMLNGDTSKTFSQFKAGDNVRLRVVNGGASSYFWLTYSGGKIMVVANDGNDVVPVMVDRLIIGPAETYDVVVTIPANMQYEFLATAEDRTGSASLWLGSGMKMPAKELPPLKLFEGMKMMNDMMKINGRMKPMGMDMSLQTMNMMNVMYPELENKGGHDMKNMDSMKGMDNMQKTDNMKGMDNMEGMKGMKGMNHSMDMSSGGITTLNYNMLKATHKTTLPKSSWKTIHINLTGNMNRYVWSMNGKTLSESDKILIEQGKNLRIILHNETMMRHPIHLHGHDFRLVNQYGAYSPMKNVVDILPMETDTLEFYASESGDWFFHCHILYHMMGGMGRVFSYKNSPPNPEIPNPDEAWKKFKRDARMFHFMFQNDFATNGNDGQLMYAGNRWAFQGEWRLGYNALHGYEVETHFGRYFGYKQYIFPYIGIDWRYRKHSTEGKSLLGQALTKDDRKVVHVGVEYTLPLLVVLDASVDNTGYFRVQLERDDIPLTPRLRASFMVNTDREWMVGGRYILTKYFSLSTHYDSDMGLGAGITFSY